MDLKTYARHQLWQQGNLSFMLWKQQERIYHTVKHLPHDVSTIVIECARQFGKSVLGVLLALEDCLQNPGVLVLIIGPTIKQTREIVGPRVKLLMTEGNCPDGLIRHLKSEDTYYFANGSELKLGGFDTNALSSRGKTIHKVYLEEIAFSEPDTFNEYIKSDLGPALTHSKHAQIYYLTTPPKIPDHPFLTDVVPSAEASGSHFRYTIDDNDALSPEQKAACIERSGGINSPDTRREYFCEVVRDASVVLIPEFDENRHVSTFELPPRYFAWTSTDWGGSRDKTVALMMVYDFKNARTLVWDERVFDAATPTPTIIDAIKHMETQHDIKRRLTDAPGQLLTDLRQIHNYQCSLPQKADLEASVNLIRTSLSQGRLLIHERCKFLRLTLRSGQWNKAKTDMLRTSTLGHCDAIPALFYGLRQQYKSNPYEAGWRLSGIAGQDYYVDDQPTHEELIQEQQIQQAFQLNI